MNAHSENPLEMNSDEMLRVRLAALRCEHRDMDAAIQSLMETSHPDQLRIVRMKKRKLQLKDQIARIEDQITPDIIA